MSHEPLPVKPYHIKISAEAFAAGLFAHAGFNVLIQYGADQPTYDFVIGRDKTFTPVSVKGTQLPGWSLAGRYVQEANYHRAADQWFAAQGEGIIFCFVSFYMIPVGKCPDCFIATPSDVATQLKKQRGGAGHGALRLRHAYARGRGAGTTDEIPEIWRFSVERISDLINRTLFRTPGH